jgi:hypothetical protein
MIERRNRMCLPLEAFAELNRGDFDRDIALQPGIVRAIDLPNATITYLSARTYRRKDSCGPSFSPGEIGICLSELSLADQKAACARMTGNTETILRLQNTFRIADNSGAIRKRPKSIQGIECGQLISSTPPASSAPR